MLYAYNIESAIWRSKLDTKQEVWHHEDDVSEMYLEMQNKIKELKSEIQSLREDAAGEEI